jgi:probable O-glycosylation ligase (exosortase A-associated)
MAFTFVLLLAPQARFPALAPLRIALMTALFASATHLASRYLRGRPVVRFTPEMRICACLVLWAILTLPFSYWPGGSVAFLLDLYFKTLIAFWLLGSIVTTMPRLRRLCWALCLMAIPIALSGVRNYLSGTVFEDGSPPSADRILGYNAPLTANPNDLALMLNLILPLAIALFLGNRKASARAVLLPIISLMIVAVIVTFSRAGFLTLAVIGLSYLWLLRDRPERAWAACALVLALLVMPFVPTEYVNRVSTITDIEKDATGSAQTRWRDLMASAEFVVAHPLVGAGVGNNVLALNAVRGPTWTEVHNVYMQYAVELGLPGLMLFLMLLTRCMERTRDAWHHCQRHSSHAELAFLAEGIRVSLIAFAVAALFHPVGYHFYFYYIAGLAVAVHTVCVRELGSMAREPVVAPARIGARCESGR